MSSTPVQLTLQEAFILATGHSANAGQLAWYDDVVARTADYGRIRTVANDYMNNLARERGGVAAIVQSVFKNGPGITLTDAEALQLISSGKAQGIDSWDKFFEYSITLQNTAGTTLDNRAQAAMDLNDSLDAAGKAGHFNGAAVDSAVKNLLQNITSAPDVKDPLMAQQHQPLQEQQHQEQQASGGVDAMKGKWQQQVGAAKIVWGKLTDDELLKSEGHHQKLAGLVQERYAITRANADEQVTKFLAMAKI